MEFKTIGSIQNIRNCGLLNQEINNRPIRVVIADDHARSRNGLRALLATSQTVKVVAEAANGWESIQLVEQLHPDLILMDVKMPVMDGIEATRQIKTRWPEVTVVVLTISRSHRHEALEAGADSFLIKGGPTDELLKTILSTPSPPTKEV